MSNSLNFSARATELQSNMTGMNADFSTSLPADAQELIACAYGILCICHKEFFRNS